MVTSHPAVKYPVKVGLIYGCAPSGHYSAARALADFFPEAIIEPVFINLAEVYPNLGPMIAKTYIEVLKKTPFLWNCLYDNDFITFASGVFKSNIFPLYHQKLSALLKEKNIGAVISTQAFSAVLTANNPALKNTPLFAVLTDFRAHSHWPAKNFEAYFVPSKAAATSLEKNGADPSKIFLSGIPVRKEFLIPRDARREREALGLSPGLFTALLTGGSHGMGEIFSAIEAIEPFFGKLQAIVMCGENKSLARKLARKTAGCRHIKILDYTASPSVLYAAADLVIAKPGGVTVAETLSLEKPLIIFSPLPGQEELNTSFLLKHNAAELAKTSLQLRAMVKRRLESVRRCEKTSSPLSKPYAARDIVATIVEKIIAN